MRYYAAKFSAKHIVYKLHCPKVFCNRRCNSFESRLYVQLYIHLRWIYFNKIIDKWKYFPAMDAPLQCQALSHNYRNTVSPLCVYGYPYFLSTKLSYHPDININLHSSFFINNSAATWSATERYSHLFFHTENN